VIGEKSGGDFPQFVDDRRVRRTGHWRFKGGQAAAVSALGLSDRAVQRLLLNVVDVSAIVPARVCLVAALEFFQHHTSEMVIGASL
jgi:hypothetical protein